jgi:hypothetical protein
MIRMDRPLRDVTEGRHFHLAAPSLGTGTLEVNVVDADHGGYVEIVCREHWAGTWAGGAMGYLVEALAMRLGPGSIDADRLSG